MMRGISPKRSLSLLLRTLHLVSFGLPLGGHTFVIDFANSNNTRTNEWEILTRLQLWF